MRSLVIPPMPGSLNAPAYTPLALAARERFLRDMAAAYSRAGDSRTAALIARDADVQHARHQRQEG
jgi:hypothetical protein